MGDRDEETMRCVPRKGLSRKPQSDHSLRLPERGGMMKTKEQIKKTIKILKQQQNSSHSDFIKRSCEEWVAALEWVLED